MRLKSKLALEHVSLLHSVLVPICKVSGGGDLMDVSGIVSSRDTGNIWTSRKNAGVLSLDKEHLKISCKGRSSSSEHDGIICYSELTILDGIFLEHRIESAAPNNQIVMEVDLVQLRMALKSVLSANSRTSNTSGGSSLLDSFRNAANHTVIKLAKRQNIPCLCLDSACRSTSKSALVNNVLSSSAGGGGAPGFIYIHHAIPVRILRYEEFESNHLPPLIPLPDVQLELNRNECHSLRTVVEKLRTLSPICFLEGHRYTGQLTIRIHTDGASIRTFYSKLISRQEGCKADDDDPEAANEEDMHNPTNNSDSLKRPQTHPQQPSSKRTKRFSPTTIKIDTKKLSSCLQWQQQHSSSATSVSAQWITSALLCFVQNEMLVLHVTLHPAVVGFFTYYIPVHYISSDDLE